MNWGVLANIIIVIVFVIVTLGQNFDMYGDVTISKFILA